MTLLSGKLRNVLYRGIKVGLGSAIILGLLEFYLGFFFIEMSTRPFLLFFGAYCILCCAVGVVLATWAYAKYTAPEAELVFKARYVAAMLLFLGLTYLNLGLLRDVGFFSFTGAISNLILLSILGLLKIARKTKKFRVFISSDWGFFQVSALSYGAFIYLTYFIFNWPIPPQSAFKIFAAAFALMAIPNLFIALIIFIIQTPVLSSTSPSFKGRLFATVLTLLLVLGVPVVLKAPRISAYELVKYEPDEGQLEQSDKPLNIIFIILDTARKDQFSFYGYHRATTPNLERFAEDATLFTNAISAAPWTVPSHASILTGLYPSKHGAYHSDDENLNFPLMAEHITLPEILRDNGYNTCALVANYAALNRESGFTQGFNTYYDEPSQFHNFFWGRVFARIYPDIRKKGFLRINQFKLSSEINKVAVNWLNKNKSDKFFLLINYMEPHSGYKYLPGEYASQYNFSWDRWKKIYPTINYEKIINKTNTITTAQKDILFDWVDCKINYLDKNLGKLFEELKELHLYDDSLIIVTSDHGHLNGEHGSFGHNTDLYNEVINIPLIIKYPKNRGRIGTNDKLIQTVDLMPEILNLLDIEPPEDIQGQPIQESNHDIISEVYRQNNELLTQLNPARYYRDLKAIYTSNGEFKYIQSTNGDSELFNLYQDPNELHNLIETNPQIADALSKRLREWQQSFIPLMTTKGNLRIDSDRLREKLKTLGYLK